jgi:hypothetical protein
VNSLAEETGAEAFRASTICLSDAASDEPYMSLPEITDMTAVALGEAAQQLSKARKALASIQRASRRESVLNEHIVHNEKAAEGLIKRLGEELAHMKANIWNRGTRPRSSKVQENRMNGLSPMVTSGQSASLRIEKPFHDAPPQNRRDAGIEKRDELFQTDEQPLPPFFDAHPADNEIDSDCMTRYQSLDSCLPITPTGDPWVENRNPVGEKHTQEKRGFRTAQGRDEHLIRQVLKKIIRLWC